MNRYFHSELESIRSKLILIGEKANEAGRLAIEGFLNSDLEITNKAASMDDAIDDLEIQIDHESVRYITLRSPVSSDVRLIMIAIKAGHDLERAGDEAHSIAKKTRSILTRDGHVEHKVGIGAMSQLAFEMMRDAITALVEEDLEKAHRIIERDREVDRIHKENFAALSRGVNGDQDRNKSMVETVLISKSIERIGDHAKNLAEEVIYLLTGN